MILLDGAIDHGSGWILLSPPSWLAYVGGPLAIESMCLSCRY